MLVTEVHIELIDDYRAERLRAYVTVIFDRMFAIVDLRVIEGENGLFLSMPSRKETTHCVECGGKNVRLARFCNNCGAFLNPNALGEEEHCRKLYHDIVHPITAEFREYLTGVVLERYRLEVRASPPDYPRQGNQRNLDNRPWR